MTFGARPLKRFIQSHIETLIARNLISGVIQKGDSILIDYVDHHFLIVKA